MDATVHNYWLGREKAQFVWFLKNVEDHYIRFRYLFWKLSLRQLEFHFSISHLSLNVCVHWFQNHQNLMKSCLNLLVAICRHVRSNFFDFLYYLTFHSPKNKLQTHHFKTWFGFLSLKFSYWHRLDRPGWLFWTYHISLFRGTLWPLHALCPSIVESTTAQMSDSSMIANILIFPLLPGQKEFIKLIQNQSFLLS